MKLFYFLRDLSEMHSFTSTKCTYPHIHLPSFHLTQDKAWISLKSAESFTFSKNWFQSESLASDLLIWSSFNSWARWLSAVCFLTVIMVLKNAHSSSLWLSHNPAFSTGFLSACTTLCIHWLLLILSCGVIFNLYLECLCRSFHSYI